MSEGSKVVLVYQVSVRSEVITEVKELMDVSTVLFCLPYLLVSHSPSNSLIKNHKI